MLGLWERKYENTWTFYYEGDVCVNPSNYCFTEMWCFRPVYNFHWSLYIQTSLRVYVYICVCFFNAVIYQSEIYGFCRGLPGRSYLPKYYVASISKWSSTIRNSLLRPSSGSTEFEGQDFIGLFVPWRWRQQALLKRRWVTFTIGHDGFSGKPWILSVIVPVANINWICW